MFTIFAKTGVSATGKEWARYDFVSPSLYCKKLFVPRKAVGDYEAIIASFSTGVSATGKEWFSIDVNIDGKLYRAFVPKWAYTEMHAHLDTDVILVKREYPDGIAFVPAPLIDYMVAEEGRE